MSALITKLDLSIPKNIINAVTSSKPAEVEIIIIDKAGTIKSTRVKDLKEEELYKKCGFKKGEGFEKRTDWTVKLSGVKYTVSVYAKIEGTANNENKYDFPPPIDSTLFFGSCAVTCKLKITNAYTNLSVDMWGKMWEKLFGGFEDLALTCAEDEAEIDELDAIPASKKTKNGYLKDGFVVDSDDSENGLSDEDERDSSDAKEDAEDDDEDGDDEVVAGGSELSEEEYDYSDDDN